MNTSIAVIAAVAFVAAVVVIGVAYALLRRKVEGERAGIRNEAEKALADARAHAQSVMAATAADISSASAGRQAQFNTDLAAKTRATEERINEAKETALASVRSVASEIAQQTAEKLAGIKVDATAADAAVGAVMQERG